MSVPRPHIVTYGATLRIVLELVATAARANELCSPCGHRPRGGGNGGLGAALLLSVAADYAKSASSTARVARTARFRGALSVVTTSEPSGAVILRRRLCGGVV